MRISPLTLALFLLPTLAVSQDSISLPLETRFGVLQNGIEIGCNQQGDVCLDYQTMTFQGERLWYQPRLPDLLRLIEWGAESDLLLLKLWSGGGSCCTSYRFLILDADGAQYTEEFGEHGFAPTDFKISEDQISFRLERDYPANIDHWRVTFDGEVFDFETVFEDDTDAETAGAGDDVTRWLGVHPAQLWRDGSERNRFREIIADAALNCLRTSTSNIASEFHLMDGYLISSGMWPRQGGARHGYIAIEIETGQPFAVQMWEGELHYYGAPREAFPKLLKDWVQEDVSRLNARHAELFGNRVVPPDYAEFCA